MTEYQLASLSYQFWGLIIASFIPATGLFGIILMWCRAGNKDNHWDNEHKETMEALRQQGEALAALIKGQEKAISRARWS